MDFFATQNAKKDIMELVQFAGNIALQASLTLVLTVLNHLHTEEELATHSGANQLAITLTPSAASFGEPFTTLNARRVTIMLLVVSALLTALQDGLTLESHAKKEPTLEVLVTHLVALQDLK
jgi:hypothetical protein